MSYQSGSAKENLANNELPRKLEEKRVFQRTRPLEVVRDRSTLKRKANSVDNFFIRRAALIMALARF